MLCQVEMSNVLSVLRFCCIARVIGFDAVLDTSDDVGVTILIHSLQCLRLTQTFFFASQEICIAGCVRQFNCNFFPFVFRFLFLMFGIMLYILHSFLSS